MRDDMAAGNAFVLIIRFSSNTKNQPSQHTNASPRCIVERHLGTETCGTLDEFSLGMARIFQFHSLLSIFFVRPNRVQVCVRLPLVKQQSFFLLAEESRDGYAPSGFFTAISGPNSAMRNFRRYLFDPRPPTRNTV